jgi:hypothetical protein
MGLMSVLVEMVPSSSKRRQIQEVNLSKCLFDFPWKPSKVHVGSQSVGEIGPSNVGW